MLFFGGSFLNFCFISRSCSILDLWEPSCISWGRCIIFLRMTSLRQGHWSFISTWQEPVGMISGMTALIYGRWGYDSCLLKRLVKDMIDQDLLKRFLIRWSQKLIWIYEEGGKSPEMSATSPDDLSMPIHCSESSKPTKRRQGLKRWSLEGNSFHSQDKIVLRLG